jgi:hypothetical protein
MGLPALAADYLFLGPLIEARLLEQVPDMPVDVCETVQQVLQADQRSRVLMVMWAGDRLAESEAGRASINSQKVHQRWLVLLALNNVARAKDARHTLAGPLLSQVHRALAGWVPEGATNPMRRANAAMRPDINAQKAIYPMGFEISLTL